ncbi:MAG: EAL domain-containing protein [Gemmatimonadota bacterium]
MTEAPPPVSEIATDGQALPAGEGIVIFDEDWRVVSIEGAAAGLLGCAREMLVGRVLWDALPHLVGTALHNRLLRCRVDGIVASFHEPAAHLPVDMNLRAEPVDGGFRLHLAAFAPPPGTESPTGTPPATRDPEASFRAVFEEAGDAILVLDAGLCVTHANQAARELLGTEGAPRLRSLLADAAEGEALEAEVHRGPHRVARELRLRRSDGAVVDCLASVSARHDATGAVAGFQAILHDVTERKADEAALRGAFHDPLTGLPNRALFLDRLGRVMKHARRRRGYRYGVLFIDLDRFKQVNDAHGHMVGDDLLVMVARRLEQSIRQEDTAGRIGGDEFAVLLDAITDVASATLVAGRVLEELARPCSVGGRELNISASIGIALSMTGYDTAEAILHDADTAMYRAKSSGRGRYEIFDTGMQERVRIEKRLEEELREALTRTEFALHYLPVISLEGGALTGMEALVRWTHPSRGTLLPAEFMGVAEKSGLIVELGWWVLREACRQLRQWQDRFPDTTFQLTMSVNLSARQFCQPDLVEVVDGILEETGLDPCCLRLEMPEAAVTEDRDTALTVLGQLRQRGVGLCIDDFGTGFTSLSELRRLPISSVKIDRSLIGELHNGASGRGMVQTIVALGQHMAIDAVAEGVETPEQLAELRALGARFAQGFLFSLPLEAAAAAELLAYPPAEPVPVPV